ncbi:MULTISPECIES: PTPA-CTERM sorting domain-containing protein [Cyanophyceae]|uniref:PTPA-CTERM sorting domain-containing protein n=1 Tax=Cyanophyceae TaxID=3028117 RepID=UPI0016849489|nr:MULTISPECIES: PTPA-CTERM sorting domain-containing protein [Cyanophyceae]MBD1917973.1 PTPA-CTERM sorting domain-containing protein [Phormidium sp. FACHB-77]MBD2029221.1 PTPA-CTERM sorting domain-containing protein [Phormidium sp. FACHB-322]MBD2049753.1 PTPA-CTERM sorting domain-containing protein [Leptolyngbya sp. FACHB-60]
MMNVLGRTFCTSIVASAFLSILVANAPAKAATLVDNRSLEVVGFLGGDPDSETQVEFGTGFDLNADAAITRILWSGAYGPSNTRTPSTDNFSVRLFTIEGVDSDGLVNTAPLTTLSGDVSYSVQRIQGYQDITEYDVYFYTLSLSNPFSLNSGVYLLSILNDTSADLDDNWGWTRTTQGGAQFRFDATEPWARLAGGLDFAIEGDVKDNPAMIPTPTVLPGLLGLGMGIWRKRRAEALANGKSQLE